MNLTNKQIYHSEEHRLLHEELDRVTNELPSDERTEKIQVVVEKIRKYWAKVKNDSK